MNSSNSNSNVRQYRNEHDRMDMDVYFQRMSVANEEGRYSRVKERFSSASDDAEVQNQEKDTVINKTTS